MRFCDMGGGVVCCVALEEFPELFDFLEELPECAGMGGPDRAPSSSGRTPPGPPMSNVGLGTVIGLPRSRSASFFFFPDLAGSAFASGGVLAGFAASNSGGDVIGGGTGVCFSAFEPRLLREPLDLDFFSPGIGTGTGTGGGPTAAPDVLADDSNGKLSASGGGPP